jgi:hypothetical protein
VTLIDVAPSRLDHSDIGTVELGNNLQQEIGMRNKVRVEDRDEITGCFGQSISQRTRLESGAHRPADVVYSNTVAAKLADESCYDVGCGVGGIVQHLHLEQVLGILECRQRADRALGHIPLIVQRQLHRHRSPLLGCAHHTPSKTLTDSAAIFAGQIQAMQTERRQENRGADVQ